MSQATTLLSLVPMGLVELEINFFLRHKTTHGHVIKESSDFLGSDSLTISHNVIMYYSPIP